MINLMVTDFYLEKPHCLETSKSRCCYVSCRRPVFSSFKSIVKDHRGQRNVLKKKNNNTIYHTCAFERTNHFNAIYSHS